MTADRDDVAHLMADSVTAPVPASGSYGLLAGAADGLYCLGAPGEKSRIKSGAAPPTDRDDDARLAGLAADRQTVYETPRSLENPKSSHPIYDSDSSDPVTDPCRQTSFTVWRGGLYYADDTSIYDGASGSVVASPAGYVQALAANGAALFDAACLPGGTTVSRTLPEREILHQFDHRKVDVKGLTADDEVVYAAFFDGKNGSFDILACGPEDTTRMSFGTSYAPSDLVAVDDAVYVAGNETTEGAQKNGRIYDVARDPERERPLWQFGDNRLEALAAVPGHVWDRFAPDDLAAIGEVDWS